MAEPAWTIAFDLRSLADCHRAIADGDYELTKDGARAMQNCLRMIAVECEQLEQQLAVARRWGPGALDFHEAFARDKLIQAGVRARKIIDLVPVLEREMARNAATRGGAA